MENKKCELIKFNSETDYVYILFHYLQQHHLSKLIN
ncbi:hypothetical protein [Okeania sp. SIO3I5]